MSDLGVRPAEARDLEAIVRLFAADETGGHGDAWTEPNRPAYEAALRRILRSEDHRLFVAEMNGEVVGTFQTTLIPSISGRGGLRLKLEGVQVRSDLRSRGIGARMIAVAETVARDAGAGSIELSSNKKRVDAHRFYERHGYLRSHDGFKKPL